PNPCCHAVSQLMSLSGAKRTYRFAPHSLLLTQSGHFDAGPRSTSIVPGFGLSSRAQSFINAQQHLQIPQQRFPQGRMIMSAQSSSAIRRRATAVEPDELVPSRYAQKIGAIDVLVISDGVLPIPSQTIAHNIEPAVRAAWLEHEFLSPEMLEWPLNV